VSVNGQTEIKASQYIPHSLRSLGGYNEVNLQHDNQGSTSTTVMVTDLLVLQRPGQGIAAATKPVPPKSLSKLAQSSPIWLCS